MYGLWEYLLKAKALAPINAGGGGGYLRVDDTLIWIP